MVSFILHMRSARRVSLSLSLSGLDKPVAWKGDHLLLPPRTGPGVGYDQRSDARQPAGGVEPRRQAERDRFGAHGAQLGAGHFDQAALR